MLPVPKAPSIPLPSFLKFRPREGSATPSRLPLSPAARDFSLRSARFFCQLSVAAYQQSEAQVRYDLTQLGVTRVRMIESRSTDTQALVARAPLTTIVAFRGTEPSKVKDLLTDVSCQLIPGALGMVHRGFWRSLEGIWEQLCRAVAEVHDERSYLWITGHSLGGALAQLAAARLATDSKPVQGIYTFGAPRCGDREFASRYAKQATGATYRVVNEQDFVPKVAPEILGYQHAGRFCHFDDAGRLLVDAPSQGDLVHTLGDAFRMLVDREDDHSLQNGYLPKLNALLSKAEQAAQQRAA